MIWFYRFVWLILLPVVLALYCLRFLKGKEDKSRFLERFSLETGNSPSTELYNNNPQKHVVWFHGSSVGETKSVLPLIHRINKSKNTGIKLLVTSGTKTSAKLMCKNLPEGVLHRYIPFDFWPFVNLFLKRYNPTISVFVESEFWPELLHQAPNPILLNARISDRSAKRYKTLGFMMRPFIQKFKACYCQTEADAARLNLLGAQNTKVTGNLKFDAEPAVVKKEDVKPFAKIFKNKQVFVASSTHNGEEEIIAEIHSRMKQKFPQLITLIAPRHPERGKAIHNTLKKLGLHIAMRSKNEPITEDTDIYIADTIGELPLWYHFADVCFIGGSLVKHGGQNPIEPLQSGCITLCGPHMFNFRKIMEIFLGKGIITQVKSAQNLETEVEMYLQSTAKRQKQQKSIAKGMKGLSGATDAAYTLLMNQLATIDKEKDTHGR